MPPTRPRLYHAALASSLGDLDVFSTDRGVCALGFGRAETRAQGRLDKRFPDATVERGDPHGMVTRLRRWLGRDWTALHGVQLDLGGTEFQQRVWAELRRIPRGETRSYGELAAAVGSVARAVGAANGANPVAIVVPCHRVVGADGRLTGYAFGVHRKRVLLRLEGAPSQRQQPLL